MKRSTQWNRGALATTLATLAFLAIGCGNQQQARTSGSPGTDHDAVVAGSSLPAGAPITAREARSTAEPERIAAVSNDSLPPDVDASITDSLVTPGTIIEITAKGSPDVEEVMLSDGIGKPQRFVYDASADLWRASYRVPVKVVRDRLGLAVTAKNELHRWRRVWVFLSVQRETAKDPAQPLVEEK